MFDSMSVEVQEDPMKESCCITCSHRGELPAAKCMQQPHCPLNQPREPISCFLPKKYPRLHKARIKPEDRMQCKYEGCNRMTGNKVPDILCYIHKIVVLRRIAGGVTGPDLLKSGWRKRKWLTTK